MNEVGDRTAVEGGEAILPAPQKPVRVSARPSDRMAPPPGRCTAVQLPALVLFIIWIASSIVKVFGFWMIGNSLNVSANLPAIV